MAFTSAPGQRALTETVVGASRQDISTPPSHGHTGVGPPQAPTGPVRPRSSSPGLPREVSPGRTHAAENNKGREDEHIQHIEEGYEEWEEEYDWFDAQGDEGCDEHGHWPNGD